MRVFYHSKFHRETLHGKNISIIKTFGVDILKPIVLLFAKRHPEFAMQPSIDDLRIAYKRTTLKRQGYSFLQCLDIPHLRICLTNLAKNQPAPKGKPAPKPLAYLED